MMKPLASFGVVLLGTLAFAVSTPAGAQTGSAAAIAADAAGSGVPVACTFGKVYVGDLDGRPGKKLFLQGAEAYRRHDYRHAVYMYKVAASYADASAEYDLGLMYFRGQGVPVDKPLGAAWMILAAESGKPLYVKARNLMVTALTNAQFAEADRLWSQLKKTYGEVGLAQANLALGSARMNDVVGSHLGVQTGPVLSGTLGPHGGLRITPDAALGGALGGQPMLQTNSRFDAGLLKCPTGTVTVEPLQSIKPPAKDKHAAKSGQATQPAADPQNTQD